MPVLQWWRLGGSRGSREHWASSASNNFWASQLCSESTESYASMHSRESLLLSVYGYSRISGVY